MIAASDLFDFLVALHLQRKVRLLVSKDLHLNESCQAHGSHEPRWDKKDSL